MIFSSPGFIFAFLPLVFLVAVLLRRIRSGTTSILIWLTMSSLFFYAFWRYEYLLLIAVSILGNWLISLWIRRTASTSRVPVFVGIVLNLLAIGFFKYFDFFISNTNALLGSEYSEWGILLPLGISFFTFQQIAFLVDTHRGLAGPTKFLEYSFFVSFFPQLIAGPIVHHRHILPGIRDGSSLQINAEQTLKGLHAFAIGLAKKVILADSLAVAASQIFDAADAGHQISTYHAAIGTLSYTFQIYFDFSGYTDMAIGLGYMFGIELPKNFDSPYKSRSIIEFWRRWHMTLSEFLRDYIYIPLGGNRKGARRRYFNLLGTMLIGGLWHGASWPFVFWGALHGMFLVVNHGISKVLPEPGRPWQRHLLGSCGFVLTFTVVALAWIPFRAVTWSGMLRMYEGLIGIFHSRPNVMDLELNAPDMVEWVLAAGVISFLFPNTWTLLQRFDSLKGVHRLGSNLVTIACLTASLYFLIYHANRVSEFIYFNF